MLFRSKARAMVLPRQQWRSREVSVFDHTAPQTSDLQSVTDLRLLWVDDGSPLLWRRVSEALIKSQNNPNEDITVGESEETKLTFTFSSCGRK